MTTLTFVQGAERMVTAARLDPEGIYVRFADERAGLVPLDDLELSGAPRRVTVPRPHLIAIHMADGTVEELPWDFARHYADQRYRARSEEAKSRGRDLLAERLRALRSAKEMTQRELAQKAGISRVSVARIETGEQLPRYATLLALAGALEVPAERLFVAR